jgi:DNA (cytosine-5)-methyltransferase 3A
MGGSPCQGFSFAGKQLAFDDPRSALFFEFVRCVEELKPKYFLLENVRMKKEYLDVISEYMGVEPIMINSALVSAQNRVRYYWTNIPGIEQPEQRGIVLRDILETNTSGEYHAGENLQKNYKGGNQLNPNYKSQANTIHDTEGKSGTICAGTHGYANGYVADVDKPNKIHDIPKDVLKDNERQRRVYGKNGKSPTLLARSDTPKVMKSDKPLHIGTAVDIKGHDQIKRVYSEDGKSSTLTTCGGGHREPKVAIDNIYWRKLTPVECERLQTVPDNYTNHVSNTQRYKMLGNGWTIEVIAHILKNMEL